MSQPGHQANRSCVVHTSHFPMWRAVNKECVCDFRHNTSRLPQWKQFSTWDNRQTALDWDLEGWESMPLVLKDRTWSWVSIRTHWTRDGLQLQPLIVVNLQFSTVMQLIQGGGKK